MKEAQREFLKSVGVENEIDALGNCVSAAFKRNKLYKEDINQHRRENLRNDLKRELLSITKQYREEAISASEHEANIQELSNRLTRQHSEILNKNRFNIGTSQKALNLFLKFLWCLGELPAEPIHCPLDGIVLKKVGIYKAWTKMDEIELYRRWVGVVQQKAHSLSISQWELKEWNLSRIKNRKSPEVFFSAS